MGYRWWPARSDDGDLSYLRGHGHIALDPAADCPASRVAEIVMAPYDDVDALRQLADRCDVLTYEFENVDADGLDAVIKDGQLPQGDRPASHLPKIAF